jgi:nitric oxide reductase NorD protein
MEEYIGGLWDKWITRVAYRGYPEARVELPEVQRIAAIFFRALGGDPGISVKAGSASNHDSRRRWLERMAGINERVELSWTDATTLHLPAAIDCFPDAELNRALYLWQIALAAHDVMPAAEWIVRNQQATIATLQALPGMQVNYDSLVQAVLQLRPEISSLSGKEAQAEQAIQQALLQPGSVTCMGQAAKAPMPVLLWLHPNPPVPQAPLNRKESTEPEQTENTTTKKDQQARKRSAQSEVMPDNKSPFMLLFRAESLFSWAEYVKVDRDVDEDENEDAQRAADDLDFMSVARDGKTTASRIRFDLDLPSEAEDDLVLADGILYPEWHYKKQQMQAAHCRVQMLLAKEAGVTELPEHLRHTAKRLRQQFQALTPQRTRLHGQVNGHELDLDACVRFASERACGMPVATPALYVDTRKQMRDLSCLLLADLSLSTDAYVNDHARVIDVIRDSLFLFGEALAATGDRFALYGFSSVRRENVRFHLLKGFDEKFEANIRGRISQIKPGYYTRMGAAIRHASALLQKQKTGRKLLLILTDGKPNDLDQYEGRYGIEDTRVAIHEARAAGLIPFCVTIDERAGDYLPHLFGRGHYVLVRNAADLPQVLPGLYAHLTAHQV